MSLKRTALLKDPVGYSLEESIKQIKESIVGLTNLVIHEHQINVLGVAPQTLGIQMLITNGLCSNFLKPFSLTYIEALFKNWEHYSGHSCYPIKGRSPKPSVTYNHAPKYSGEYGRLRFKLARHIIKELRKDLKTLNKKLREQNAS